MIKSIFDLEKRITLSDEYKKILAFLDKKQFQYCSCYSCTFWDLVDRTIIYWPYRSTALNHQDFFHLVEISPRFSNLSDEKRLYVLQFIIDYIRWFYLYYDGDFIPNEHTQKLVHIFTDNAENFILIIENVDIILEKMNYKREVLNEHFTFVKRDADIDSVLNQVEDNIDVRMLLLSYNDFRNNKDCKTKMHILKALGDYIEPMRKELKEFDSSLTEDVFYLLNTGKVRHPEKENQIDYHTVEKQIEWYDKLFKMILHLLRYKDIKEIKNELKSLKNK